MRRQFYGARAAGDGLPEGHLLFDLITPDRDTFKTRLDPMGARFRPAKPWIDAHGDDSANRCIGSWEVREQIPARVRVQVSFDMADDNAAKIYRKHKDGVLDGCSVGFDPIRYHMIEEPDGQKTLVYDEYWVLEGSSCPVNSNPTALVVRSADMKRGDFDVALREAERRAAAVAEAEALQFCRAALVAASGLDASDVDVFLAVSPRGPSAGNLAALGDALASTSFIRKSEKPPTTVQTLIFAKDGPHGSAEKAKSWAEKHGFKSSSVDETGDSFRLRQKDPGDFADGSLKTIELTSGVKAVVGHPKSKRGAAGASRSNNHPDATRRDAATVGPAPAGTFSQQTEAPSMKTHEHRSHHRYMIGDKLRAAQDHMEAIGMHSKEEHRKFHRESAEHAMEGAQHLARMINESIAEGHADAPADAALTANMIRSVPSHLAADAAIVAKWDACQRAALPHAGQTFRQAAELLGAKSPEDLVTSARAQEDIVAAHKKLLSQNRSAEKDKESKERADLVASLVSGPVGLSPARECEMLGLDPSDPKRQTRSAAGPWSIERIRKYELAVNGAIPEVQIRAALNNELRGADGKPVPQSFGGNAPSPRSREDVGAGAGGAAGDAEAALLDAAKRMKISPEKLRSAQEFGRR